MHRNYKAGLYSNNRIKYNKNSNEKTYNIKQHMDKITINVSNTETKKVLRNSNYKITYDDYDGDDDYDSNDDSE